MTQANYMPSLLDHRNQNKNMLFSPITFLVTCHAAIENPHPCGCSEFRQIPHIGGTHPDTAVLVDLALGGRYNREGSENTELVLNSNKIPLDNRIWGEKITVFLTSPNRHQSGVWGLVLSLFSN